MGIITAVLSKLIGSPVNNLNDKLWWIQKQKQKWAQFKLSIHSWSSIQNINCRRLRIWKKNALLNLINNQPDIDTIYLYAKDPYEDKYQFLIKKRESIGLKHFNEPKAFVEYSNDMHDVYKNITIISLIKKIKY